jgi:hypothetical protein
MRVVLVVLFSMPIGDLVDDTALAHSRLRDHDGTESPATVPGRAVMNRSPPVSIDDNPYRFHPAWCWPSS